MKTTTYSCNVCGEEFPDLSYIIPYEMGQRIGGLTGKQVLNIVPDAERHVCLACLRGMPGLIEAAKERLK